MISINKEGILGLHRDVGQLSKDQVGLALHMTGFEAQVCRCGEGSEWLSDMLYQEPPVASGSGVSFPSGGTSSPIPIPPPVSQVPAADVLYLHRDRVLLIRRTAALGPSSPLSKR